VTSRPVWPYPPAVPGPPEPQPVDELLAEGRRLLDEARATIADLDSAMNTAVNVIPKGALDAPPDDEQP
jgi:hypothetical protein